MSNKLAQLGLDYIFSLDGEKVRRKVKFSVIEISPDEYRFRVNSDKLPRGVNEEEMTASSVITGLEATIGKVVTYHLGTEGLWYLIARDSSLHNIPRFVKYEDVYEIDSRDDLLALPIGQGAGRMPIKISLQHETTAHFLIGGATGTGKTVLLHAIISSLLQSDPKKVRLLLIDLKGCEFPVYGSMPHLLRPVVTDPNDVLEIVRYLWGEVERRRGVIQSEGGMTNNIAKYNRIHRASPMQYLVCIFDEIAVLMTDKTIEDRDEIESLLCRVASTGRSYGIHLILATQKPTSKVLTTMITANFPGRIALACATFQDSINIIGNSEAYFDEADIPPGRAVIAYGRFRRQFQCAYITDGRREQIISDVAAGKLAQRRMHHDVTVAELHRYCVKNWPAEDDSFTAYWKKTLLLAQFKDRGLTRLDIDDLTARYCKEPYNVEGDQYMLGDDGTGTRKRQALLIFAYDAAKTRLQIADCTQTTPE
jgi:hypothetical protein